MIGTDVVGWVGRCLLGVVAGSGAGMAAAAAAVRWWGRRSVTRELAMVSTAPVVIVPGARVFPDGRPSMTLRDRLDAAVEVYEAGLVSHFLVSGANDLPDFDEPMVMRHHLVGRGVPLSHITVDQAGVSTWATCRRARRVLGIDRAVFVTQHPYAHRAATLCQAAGIDATVLSIDPPRRRRTNQVKALVREAFANVKACLVVLVVRWQGFSPRLTFGLKTD